MKKKALLSVNSAVLLFGLAGLFAKWIPLPAIGITFGRVFFSSLALGLILLVRGTPLRFLEKGDGLRFLLAGAILAVHWWAFLKSIQLSTVAIGTITFSSYPLFVVLMEPFMYKTHLDRRKLLLALVILAGVLSTIPQLSLENSTVRGILIGELSALCYAILTFQNESFSHQYDSLVIAFYEQAVAAVLLLPFAFTIHWEWSTSTIGLLAVLGVITTGFAHTLFIRSLRDLSSSTAGLISSLEMVYGILFAALFLKEAPSFREVLGGVLILTAVVLTQLDIFRSDSKS